MKTRAKQRPRKEGNPDLRRQRQTPALEIPQLVEELKEYLTPCLFTPLKYVQGNHEKLMRERLLTLPVMVALVVSLVYRNIPGLSETVRLLQQEGLLWVKPLKVSKQAVSKRLMNFLAEIFAVLLKKVLEKRPEVAKKNPLKKQWETVREKFSAYSRWVNPRTASETAKNRPERIWGTCRKNHGDSRSLDSSACNDVV